MRQDGDLAIERPGNVVNLKRLFVRGIVVANQKNTAFFNVAVVPVIHRYHHFQLILAISLLGHQTFGRLR